MAPCRGRVVENGEPFSTSTAPRAVAWSPCYYNADHYGDLTENQRAILTPPSAYGPSSHTAATWQRAQAEQAELTRLRKEVAELRGRA